MTRPSSSRRRPSRSSLSAIAPVVASPSPRLRLESTLSLFPLGLEPASSTSIAPAAVAPRRLAANSPPRRPATQFVGELRGPVVPRRCVHEASAPPGSPDPAADACAPALRGGDVRPLAAVVAVVPLAGSSRRSLPFQLLDLGRDRGASLELEQHGLRGPAEPQLPRAGRSRSRPGAARATAAGARRALRRRIRDVSSTTTLRYEAAARPRRRAGARSRQARPRRHRGRAGPRLQRARLQEHLQPGEAGSWPLARREPRGTPCAGTRPF